MATIFNFPLPSHIILVPSCPLTLNKMVVGIIYIYICCCRIYKLIFMLFSIVSSYKILVYKLAAVFSFPIPLASCGINIGAIMFVVTENMAFHPSMHPWASINVSVGLLPSPLVISIRFVIAQGSLQIARLSGPNLQCHLTMLCLVIHGLPYRPPYQKRLALPTLYHSFGRCVRRSLAFFSSAFVDYLNGFPFTSVCPRLLYAVGI